MKIKNYFGLGPICKEKKKNTFIYSSTEIMA